MEQLEKDMTEDNKLHSGFSTNGSIAGNIIVLKCCMKDSLILIMPLFIVTVDFTKVFDSVNRAKVIVNNEIQFLLWSNWYNSTDYGIDKTCLYLNGALLSEIQ